MEAEALQKRRQRMLDGSEANLLDNRLRVYGDRRYAYDTQGNLIEKKTGSHTVQCFSWDAEQQLTESVTERHINDPKRQQTIRTRYGYDVMGRRVWKHCETKQANQPRSTECLTIFAWDGQRMVEEIEHVCAAKSESTAPRTRLTIYEPNSFVPLARLDSVEHEAAEDEADATSETLIDARARLSHQPEDQAAYASETVNDDEDEVPNLDPALWMNLPTTERTMALRGLTSRLRLQGQRRERRIRQAQRRGASIGAQRNTRVLYYQCDHLGTPQELTDAEGRIVWAARYSAWGKVQSLSVGAAETAGGTARSSAKVSVQSTTQSLRFQGQYHDEETGLHYNRFRYYDPDVGRFISQDPIGLLGGTNPFQYALNPTVWIDPFGLQSGNPTSCNQCPNLHRPYIRRWVRREVESRARKNDKGQFIDPNINKPIEGKYDFGHKIGHEFRTEKAKETLI